MAYQVSLAFFSREEREMQFTRGTKRYFIASLHAQGLSSSNAYSELAPKVREQVKPWIFSRNVNGSRIPKRMSEQLVELQHEINRVYALLEKMKGDGLPAPVPAEVEPDEPEAEPEVEDEELPLKAKGKRNKDEEKRFFLSEWKRIRRWIHETSDRTGAAAVDSLDTMRPVQAARALIDVGISASTLLYAMAMHWPTATLENAGITPVDFKTEAEPIEGENGELFHKLAGYVLKLAQAKIVDPKTKTESHQPIMLIGPAGTGKSKLASQVASLIRTESHPDGLPYGETPMTPGATRGDLLGRHTISGFVPSQFVEIYSGGGVFNFEEIDAADPSMLIVVNNALASGRLFNSVNGEVYDRHEDFIAVATGNTFGLGGNAQYTGREKLDLATIDRFRMGRVILTLDEDLADSLMFS
jgi:hypothetical protein